MVLAVLMLFHCGIFAFFVKRRKELPDLILTVGETSAFVYLNFALFMNDLPAWAPQTYIFCVVAFYIQVISLGIVILLHIYSIFGKQSDDVTEIPPLALLLGRFLFTDRDSSYFSKPTLTFRALSAAALVVMIGVFGFLDIVILPIHESGLVPVKEYRTDNTLVDNPGMEPLKLSITAYLNLANAAAYDVELFKAAVNVTPLWNEDSLLKPACEYQSDEIFNADGANIPSIASVQTITISCPSRFVKPGQNGGGSVPIFRTLIIC